MTPEQRLNANQRKEPAKPGLKRRRQLIRCIIRLASPGNGLRMRKSLTIALLLIFCAGCHSLTQLRVEQEILSGDQRAVVGVWFMGRGQPITGGDAPVVEAVTAVLLYPLDVLSSSAVAVCAAFDANMDITWGLVGAAAGIALPWVTLVPHLYPPPCMFRPAPSVELSVSDFELLLTRIRSGDGMATYRELVDHKSWACGREPMMCIVLVEGPHAAAAQQAQRAGRSRESQ